MITSHEINKKPPKMKCGNSSLLEVSSNGFGDTLGHYLTALIFKQLLHTMKQHTQHKHTFGPRHHILQILNTFLLCNAP